MTDAEIERLATRFAAGLTEAIVEILAQHEDNAHDEDRATSWAWTNHHSVRIRQASEELIRELWVAEDRTNR